MNAARTTGRDDLQEITMKNTARRSIRFRYAATLFGALAIVAVAPATAFAEPNGPTGGGGGCHYTDPDGYDIPIDEGQGVIVAGKLVTCTNGKTVVTDAPARTHPRPPASPPNHLPVLTRKA
ncbi:MULTISPECIES: hypothetical protein [unclassified Mycobacterium]|uniref:hypothetical protein n=1 Tax=unclassified Mycobacterium TaxID=2642494 RepID=UPI001E4E4E59|nr:MULTISPECIES: hypothetical protein [unclassified Mycobacterium]